MPILRMPDIKNDHFVRKLHFFNSNVFFVEVEKWGYLRNMVFFLVMVCHGTFVGGARHLPSLQPPITNAMRQNVHATCQRAPLLHFPQWMYLWSSQCEIPQKCHKNLSFFDLNCGIW